MATEDQIPYLYDYPRRDSFDIRVYLERLLQILEMGAFDSVICSTVFITEAVMRMISEQHDIDFEPQSPKTLAQTFFAHNFFNSEEYEALVTALDLRDRMIFNQEKLSLYSNSGGHSSETGISQPGNNSGIVITSLFVNAVGSPVRR